MTQAEWPLVAVLALPLVGGLAAIATPRHGARIAGATVAGAAAALIILMWQMLSGGVITASPGGWGAPLGIVLKADGLAVAFMAMTAAVMAGVVALAARDHAITAPFWPLALFL